MAVLIRTCLHPTTKPFSAIKRSRLGETKYWEPWKTRIAIYQINKTVHIDTHPPTHDQLLPNLTLRPQPP